MCNATTADTEKTGNIYRTAHQQIDYIHINHSSYNYLLLHITYHLIACYKDYPCSNGGTCTDGICHCNSGYHGNRCQYGKNIDICTKEYHAYG